MICALVLAMRTGTPTSIIDEVKSSMKNISISYSPQSQIAI